MKSSHSIRRRRDLALAMMATILIASEQIHALTLLSDLPTPSIIIDVPALLRRTGTTCVPSIQLQELYDGNDNTVNSSNGVSSTSSARTTTTMMVPQAFNDADTNVHVNMDGVVLSLMSNNKNDNDDDDDNVHDNNKHSSLPYQETFLYMHTRVTRSREQAVHGQDDPVGTFLAETDYTGMLSTNNGATLVLGLNNHHVGSYYWARSAGAGAAMEAPGIVFDVATGVLRWQSESGPVDCNSNDGKRSEWVNFLRPGDNVQLVPLDAQDAVTNMILQQQEQIDTSGKEQSSVRLFGVSAANRPLGSEPAVVCCWTPESSNE